MPKKYNERNKAHDDRQPERAGDTKTLAVSMFEPELDILEKILEEHRGRGSKQTYSSIIRHAIHALSDKDVPDRF